MERLTIRSKFTNEAYLTGKADVCWADRPIKERAFCAGCHCHKGLDRTNCGALMLIDRLAAYEDMGLEPEEIISAVNMAKVACALEELSAYKELGSLDRLRELAEADREGRCVVLNMPRKPLVWGDDDQNTCLCPYCGKDLMGIPYGERMVLQCPECGQYLDATKVITREEAEAALATDC